MKVYKFIKTGPDWYIDLPEFIEQGGNLSDLQMVEGAYEMLDMMAGREQLLALYVSTEYFELADTLKLVEKCEPNVGGGYYVMNHYGASRLTVNYGYAGL